MKYCIHCGRELFDEAVLCPSCGCSCAPRVEANSNLLTTFCERLQINGIIWLIVGILQLAGGWMLNWFIAIVGILNIISSIQDMNASKTYRNTPIGIVKRVTPLAGPIITMVYNVLFGGVIGVVGSIYYLVAIRGFVLANEAAFLQLESNSPVQIS